MQDTWNAAHQQFVVGKIVRCTANLERWNMLRIRKNTEEKV